jgi:hypothetical protein
VYSRLKLTHKSIESTFRLRRDSSTHSRTYSGFPETLAPFSVKYMPNLVQMNTFERKEGSFRSSPISLSFLPCDSDFGFYVVCGDTRIELPTIGGP